MEAILSKEIQAALDARSSEDTLIIARTDALGVNGFEDAMQRAEDYLQAGADALFIEAPQTLEQMETIGQRFGARIPLVHNLVEGGNSPVEDADALANLGYRIALYPAALLNIVTPVAETILRVIADTGSTASLKDQMYDLFDLNRLLGAEELLATGAKFGGED